MLTGRRIMLHRSAVGKVSMCQLQHPSRRQRCLTCSAARVGVPHTLLWRPTARTYPAISAPETASDQTLAYAAPR